MANKYPLYYKHPTVNISLKTVKPQIGEPIPIETLQAVASELDHSMFDGKVMATCEEGGLGATINIDAKHRFTLGNAFITLRWYDAENNILHLRDYFAHDLVPIEFIRTAIYSLMLYAFAIQENLKGKTDPAEIAKTKAAEKNPEFVNWYNEQMAAFPSSADFLEFQKGFMDWAVQHMMPDDYKLPCEGGPEGGPIGGTPEPVPATEEVEEADEGCEPQPEPSEAGSEA